MQTRFFEYFRISFFAHNFFIFENFSKISICVPPKPTLLYNFDFTKNFVSLTLKIDFFVICVVLRNTNISHYFWRKPQISPQRSRDTKKVHLSKVVDHGRFRGDANWNFWKIFKNEKVMCKKRNSEIFEKSCLHQLKINLRYSNLENRILLEKLTFKHVHCAHTICRSWDSKFFLSSKISRAH